MLEEKNKGKIAWILFGVSVVLNIGLAYMLIDNVITASYREMSLQYSDRQKTDAIDFLNLTLENNPGFDFSNTKERFLKAKERLYKPDDEGRIVLGELCFKRDKRPYQASFCSP
jgi:hypothetical protein